MSQRAFAGSRIPCPSPAEIDSKLDALAAFFGSEKDSDLRGSAVDRFNAEVPTPCLSAVQAARLLLISRGLAAQARSEEASFDLFGGGITGLVTRIAVGALGAGLVIVGLIMIGSEVTLGQAATRFGKAIASAGVKVGT